MKITIVGSGDAFGSGGRFNTCFLVESGNATVAVDFGATSLVALKRLGRQPNEIDAIVLSHLHGDHFGGLPFLLLDCQFAARRTRPLTIVGPVGTAARLEAALEVFFPGASRNAWNFPVSVVDLPCRTAHEVSGWSLETREVVHPSGAPATAIRLHDGRRLLAYSGDTAWTEALVDVARGADLFICECYAFAGETPNHLSFATLEEHRSRLDAGAVMLTHMSDETLARAEEMAARGYRIAQDGLIVHL